MCDAYFRWVVGQCLAVKPAQILAKRVCESSTTIRAWAEGRNLPAQEQRFAIHRVLTQVLSPEAYEKFSQ